MEKEVTMEKSANIGLFFQRGYFEGLDDKIWSEKDKQEDYFKAQNKVLKESSKVNAGTIETSDGQFALKTVYPGLITGIGMLHATGMQGEGKLGMAFDYTSGLPYIPGSSVKGLLRSLFPIPSSDDPKKISKEENELLAAKCEFLNDTCKKLNILELSNSEWYELASIIFNGKAKEGILSIYERDIFYDAQIKGDYSEKGILDFDYITPHKNPLKNPEPIKFLKILPEVTFVFDFNLHDSILSSKKTFKAEYKKTLFKKILTTVGIGAKTNVGYGQLKTV